jgi:hypothetical protein
MSRLDPRTRKTVWEYLHLKGGLPPRNLLDHRIGTRQHQRGNGDPQRLRRLQADDQLEACRLLNRQIGRLRALEQSGNLVGGKRIKFGN